MEASAILNGTQGHLKRPVIKLAAYLNWLNNRYHLRMFEQRSHQHFLDSADLIYQAAEPLSGGIARAVEVIGTAVTNDCKVLVCGNGGSAADAEHFVASFVSRFERERPELAAIALTAHTSIITAIGHDYSYTEIFAKQVRALGQVGDVLLVISANGNPSSILAAIEAAHGRDMSVVALTGKGSGKINEALGELDIEICVPHDRAARIQEVHILALHCICDGVDAMLLGETE